MGILDRLLGRKAMADPSAPLPLPLGQSRDIYLTGYGSGQLVSMLRRVLPGSHRDWSLVAGDLGLNSVIAPAMDWYIRNCPKERLGSCGRWTPSRSSQSRITRSFS